MRPSIYDSISNSLFLGPPAPWLTVSIPILSCTEIHPYFQNFDCHYQTSYPILQWINLEKIDLEVTQ